MNKIETNMQVLLVSFVVGATIYTASAATVVQSDNGVSITVKQIDGKIFIYDYGKSLQEEFVSHNESCNNVTANVVEMNLNIIDKAFDNIDTAPEYMCSDSKNLISHQMYYRIDQTSINNYLIE